MMENSEVSKILQKRITSNNHVMYMRKSDEYVCFVCEKYFKCNDKELIYHDKRFEHNSIEVEMLNTDDDEFQPEQCIYIFCFCFCFCLMNLFVDDLIKIGSIMFDQNKKVETVDNNDGDFFEGLLNGRSVHVKRLNNNDSSSEQKDREEAALRRNDCELNIVTLHIIEEDENFYYSAYERSLISLEYYTQENKNGKDYLTNVKKILEDATIGLESLHKVFNNKADAHRYIRPQNILICDKKGESVGKISNLLMSKDLSADREGRTVSGEFPNDVNIDPL